MRFTAFQSMMISIYDQNPSSWYHPDRQGGAYKCASALIGVAVTRMRNPERLKLYCSSRFG